MLMTIEPYSPAQRDEWNRLVRDSRNATFLLDRDYMDYHSDRFPDRVADAPRRPWPPRGRTAGHRLGHGDPQPPRLTYGVGSWIAATRRWP